MRLVSVTIHEAEACGNLLNGLSLNLERPGDDDVRGALSTLCLVGPNGSGKSQFLQTITEIFQDAWHTCAPDEERAAPNKDLTFELVYDLVDSNGKARRVRLSRLRARKRATDVRMEHQEAGNWVEIEPLSHSYRESLPPVIVGYTSGDNETLSLPFFKSRAAYAKEVSSAALDSERRTRDIPDNRLLLIDYGTNLEVLIANLMLGEEELRVRMLEHAALAGIASWQCIIQLQPATVTRTKPINGRRGVKLTEELETILSKLRACSTCQSHDSRTDTYTLDFFVDEQTRTAFRDHWKDASQLYRSFHKFAMLNDLAIPKKARSRLAKQIKRGHFAARLPEPQDEHKVFRFEEVRFRASQAGDAPVDYVALSDGEHQQAQIFGVFSMITEPNALFLLDEPESHFNPRWRVEFIKRLTSIPLSKVTPREVILTSHAPFVPSDMRREQVIKFRRTGTGSIEARNPVNETFGTSFDRILKDCFEVEPPISQMARDEIRGLSARADVNEIEKALPTIGSSVEKAFLVDKLEQLKAGEE